MPPGGGRRSGDVGTPEGTVENTQSRGGSGSLGVSYVGVRGYLGASYGYEDTRYGIPLLEEGTIELTPHRQKVGVRSELRDIDGFVESVRVSVGYRRYRHEELKATAVGTRFENDAVEVEVLANHKAYGRLTGTFGGWTIVQELHRNWRGSAVASGRSDSGRVVRVREEVAWPHFTFQAGGRLDYATFTPQANALPDRDFTELSGSVGLLFRPSAAEDHLTFAVSLARAARPPALEEMYFFGEHPGNLVLRDR